MEPHELTIVSRPEEFVRVLETRTSRIDRIWEVVLKQDK
jgi:hypothetical protein